ncbi:ABC-F family ATP-binding cassette domain-containing protein [Pseudovibrio sp. Tun.PSC04-5.I4]|uniref:ABC-F family ATP-binding cassette domain-containing protein n=1 Tax=Pseudovibrio sp. Tun.PSC04-5.I4 TaxID=1798213 RepID=UPI000881F55C|nr:ABC-F family ATP-binding cassette domain-containing protein [Pseudovibrio sp. Tun.PSC04-5.I4]SDQ87009.1 ATP-binding cassette, subfamily F, uup [Pseudovibrio sp. Tun.PSC04-5.I4]
MAPPLLHVRDIHLNFGTTPLLNGAELQVGEGERICLVGRNGSGKSTLLKIAAGLAEPDKGDYFLQPGRTIRYLPQEPDLAGYPTVLAYVEAGLAPGDDQYRAKYLLEILGLTGEEDPETLSGGEGKRAAIARALAPEPDILLLDEPTNHLDLPVIEWLESELKQMRSAIVLISHDRRFLENLSRVTYWIDRGTSRRMDQGFAKFEEWRDKVFEEEEKEQSRLNEKIRQEEHWMVYGVTARRKRNMRRVRELGDLRQQRRDHKGPQGTVKMAATEGDVSGKMVSEAKGISKSYEERPIVKDFSTRILRGDRIGFVGPNGAGKTTLLKMLTGELAADSGTIRLGANIQMITLDQKREKLNPNDNLVNAMTGGSGDTVILGDTSKHVMSYLRDFLFTPEQARTPVRVLSGGERGRLLLARALASPSNLMVLDEPTNDLDLETLDLLQELISDYPGTVLLVSHDRDFLDRICTSIITNEDDIGKWGEYAGGYTDMVRQRGEGVQARKSAKAEKASTAAKGDKPAKAAPKQEDKKSGLNFTQKHRLKAIPGEMEKVEAKIVKHQKEMEDPRLFISNPDRFHKISNAIGDFQKDLETLEEEWMELAILADES